MTRHSIRASIEGLDPVFAESAVQHTTDVERVRDTAEVLYASGRAASLYEDAQSAARDVDELTALRDVVEAVNSNEGWTDATLSVIETQQAAIRNRLNIAPFLHMRTKGSKLSHSGVRVSTEDMGQIINTINTSAVDLEERSISALTNLLTALSDTVPKAYARLSEIQQRAADQSDRDSISPVTLDPRVEQRLKLGDRLPDNLSNYINSYCKYGATLLTKYAEVSFKSVMQSTTFQNGIDGASYQGFWETVESKLKNIRDPRSELTDEQLRMTLPGGRTLFHDAVENEYRGNAPTVRDRLRQFIQSYRPVSLSEFAEEPGDCEASQLPALRASVIRDCASYLMDLSKDINIRAVVETCRSAWVDSSRTIRVLRESLRTSDSTLLQTLDGDERLVSGYLETHFMLSAWPLLNYLTSVTLFVNAFVDYADASLRAPDGASTELVGGESGDAKSDSSGEVELVDDVDDLEEDEDETSEDSNVDVSPSGWVRDSSDVDVSDTQDDDAEQESETEVPDTGETPDQPQDATGDGKRAIVEGVEETIENKQTESEPAETATPSETAATPETTAPAAEPDTNVDVSEQPAPANTDVDVSGGEAQPEEEKKDDTSTNVDVSA